jgi:uncharacterized protein (TIGR03790 family)
MRGQGGVRLLGLGIGTMLLVSGCFKPKVFEQKWEVPQFSAFPLVGQASPQPPAPSASQPSAQPAPDSSLSKSVLIVFNQNDADSILVANHYLNARKIPGGNLCPIRPGSTTALSWNDFVDQVRDPVKNCVERVGKKQILYIVFTYNTPYRLKDVPDSEGVAAGPDLKGVSADQFISDLYGYNKNKQPYYAENPYFPTVQTKDNVYPAFESLAGFRANRGIDIYSVFRLDAATPELARGLVDKAIAAEKNGLKGNACIDLNSGPIEGKADSGYDQGNWNHHRVGLMSKDMGFNVIEDVNNEEFGTAPAPLRCENAALYSGWYAFNQYNDAFSWAPGAIGLHLDSWSAPDPRGGANWSANALMHGITVTSGALEEPDMGGVVQSDIAFRALFAGANVGDAFFRGLSMMRWQIINMGDPLYRPFPGSKYPK